MDTREKEIENLKDYKYGFTTDIENIKAPKGLNEEVIKFISRIKKDLNFVPTKSTAELMLDAHNYYLNNSDENQQGSAIKPKMGFFSVIKFDEKSFINYFKINDR